MFKARNPESNYTKLFATTTNLKVSMQTDAYNWTRTKPVVKFLTLNITKHYFISPADQLKSLHQAEADRLRVWVGVFRGFL
jgi:hypothetical protein